MADRESDEVGYILPAPTHTVTDHNILGRRKTFAGLQVTEWAFLAVSLSNIAVSMSMTIYSLVRVIKTDPKSPDFTLTILLLINGGFCVFYVLNGVLREKEFEIYVFIGAISFILTYCVLEYTINVNKQSQVKLARLVICSIMAPINVFLAIFVAREFGWLEFKIVGASEVLQHMYRESSRYTSLLKFDLQVMINFVLLVLKNGISVTLAEKITLAVGLPVSFLWCTLGWISMRRESRCGMIAFALFGLCVPAYVSFAIFKIYQAFHNNSSMAKGDVLLVYISIAAISLALLIRGIVYIEAWRVYHNFDKGLRERAFEIEANERTSLLAVPRRR